MDDSTTMDTNQPGNTTESTTQSGENQTQDTNGKTFTQDELNTIVAKRLSQAQKKYEDIDIQEYQTLKTAKNLADDEKMLNRQEFDKLLKQTADRKDSEINKLRSELLTVRVDGALVNAASKHKATNPEHVARLLRDSIKLDDSGKAVVLDQAGEIRYNTDTGESVGIDDVVEEFMNSNPYFKAPGKPGTSSTSNTQSRVEQELDLATLTERMRSGDRKAGAQYKQLMKEGKI
jgi:hypothetical protein